jgi:hypothetical protein
MCCSPISGESATLSVTDECRVWDGDMRQCRKLYPVPSGPRSLSPGSPASTLRCVGVLDAGKNCTCQTRGRHEAALSDVSVQMLKWKRLPTEAASCQVSGKNRKLTYESLAHRRLTTRGLQ